MANSVAGPAPRTKSTPRARKRFLERLRETANVTEAARSCNTSRDAAYRWRKVDPEFAAAWDTAVQEAVDSLEREAWRRGVEGYDKPVIYQGEITGSYREYSDRLLETLLKGHRPEKYRDNRTEISGTLTVQRVERVVIDASVAREVEREALESPTGAPHSDESASERREAVTVPAGSDEPPDAT